VTAVGRPASREHPRSLRTRYGRGKRRQPGGRRAVLPKQEALDDGRRAHWPDPGARRSGGDGERPDVAERCDAVKVDDQVAFGASAGAVNRRWAGQLPASKRADVAAVDHPERPVKPSCGVESSQQFAMQPSPHAGRLPVAQPPPRRDAGAAHLLRHQPPR